MTTNEVLKRIELPNGYSLEPFKDEKGEWIGYDLCSPEGTLIFGDDKMDLEQAQDFGAAMQPQVSESDEAVARALELVRMIAEYPDKTLHEAGLVAKAKEAYPILARHRQPAAVSADAVEIARKVGQELPHPLYQADLLKHFDVNAAAKIIQAYGDACRLDCGRKMREVAADYVETYYGSKKLANAIRALSPETVCGGE